MSATDSHVSEDTAARPLRICLTPVRNENWIIRQFAHAAQTWANHVIIADQQSSDGTRETLASIPNIRVVSNTAPGFDELHRQRLLLEEARRHTGKRILIGLDGDEVLSANHLSSNEWQRIERAEPGTVLRFRWVNILPGFNQAWIPPNGIMCGFIDDGTEHAGKKIGSPRVPNPVGAPVLDLEEIVILHFQYVAWDRMLCKQRWYQAWEYSQNRERGALDIFRMYNHMHGGWPKDELQPVRSEWLAGYEARGIDFHSLRSEPITWWDREIVQMLCQHGPAHFRRIAIWNQDWNSVARRLGVMTPDLRDPRSQFEKVAHRILRVTQSHRGNWGVRGFERALRLAGW